ncbi:hypothetical protein KW807_02445 [Candidatus Parcubacteria bacterium]|nr:hypothetical protein [Candidatus Parcubacteria bacterium]
MKSLTHIAMGNKWNTNSTVSFILGTVEEVVSILRGAGWNGDYTNSGASLEKDGVWIMLEQTSLFETAEEALQSLFFSS